MNELRPLLIKVADDGLWVGGDLLRIPVTERDVIKLLGVPDRVIPGTPPAPPGHRNNEAYVYDSYGIYWLRQHDSDQMIGVTAVFRQSEGPIKESFMPAHAFSGTIALPQMAINASTLQSELRERLRRSPDAAIANLSAGYVGPFHISSLTVAHPRTVRSKDSTIASVSIGLRGPPSSRRNRQL